MIPHPAPVGNWPAEIGCRCPQPIPVRPSAPLARPGPLPSIGYAQNPWPGAARYAAASCGPKGNRQVCLLVDAPTRAAVAPVHLGVPGWLQIFEPGGSREVGRGPRRREAVGASGRRRGDAACWGRSRGPSRGWSRRPHRQARLPLGPRLSRRPVRLQQRRVPLNCDGIMDAISRFTLEQHDGPYETWPLRSRLFLDGEPTGISLPGYALLHQFETSNGYVLVTDYDCPFEEITNFILVSKQLRL